MYSQQLRGVLQRTCLGIHHAKGITTYVSRVGEEVLIQQVEAATQNETYRTVKADLVHASQTLRQRGVPTLEGWV